MPHVSELINKVRATPGYRPVVDAPAFSQDRVWPAELESLLGDRKAVACAPGPFLNICPNCGGMEVMMVYVIHEGPMKFPRGKAKWLEAPEPGWYLGELRSEACPICKGDHLRDYLAHNCGLAGRDLYATMEGFKCHSPFENKQKAANAARALLAMNTAPAGFVTFHGPYGVGKSHLLKALVNGFRGIGVMARYRTLSELLGDIQERFGENHGVEEVVSYYRRMRVLCLDEIDKVQLTSWSSATIARLLICRHDQRDDLLTVLGMNVIPEKLPEEFGYLTSRMRGGVVVEVGGPDMRPAQGRQARLNLAQHLRNAETEGDIDAD